MSWHLNQKFSIGVLILLASNILTTVWWAAKLDTTVTNLGDVPARVTANEKTIIELQTENRLMRGTLGEFKQTMTTFNNTISRIDREQARRTPMVKHMEGEMSKHSTGG